METNFDAIIVGGSYAGLSAGMALARSLRNVLIIDSGSPCNSQTPHSHNLITHDGDTPANIARQAKRQVLQYKTVNFKNSLVTAATKKGDSFVVSTWDGDSFTARKILFATGVIDVMPDIPGFAECWGISVLHCPYCHGFEVKHLATGILGNGDGAFEYAKLISNWTNDLTIFTNGESLFTEDQLAALTKHSIKIDQTLIAAVRHHDGMIEAVEFIDGSSQAVKAIYHKAVLKQHCTLPEELGCELNEHGFIKIDNMQQTSVPGVFAAGDNTTMFRSLAIAIADGSKAGAIINKQLVDEEF
jgi:thioredoxin reductase